jgi:hypothetical protein
VFGSAARLAKMSLKSRLTKRADRASALQIELLRVLDARHPEVARRAPFPGVGGHRAGLGRDR